jgi:hypothetical protein
MHSLDHFYYGQLIHHGAVAGEPRVLAKSGGISDDHVKTALRVALLPALANAPAAAWALVRGGSKELPYVLVQAQLGSVGQITRHVYFPSGDLVRAIAGNVQAWLPLIEAHMPEFAMLGDALAPITLPEPPDLTTENQVDLLLELMSATRNNTRTIEPLLSAIIKNIPLVIHHAPPDGAVRSSFIQGLLSLLPASTRFAVMFATHLTLPDAITAQIAFYEGTAPENAVLYDWQTGKVGGVDTKDDYSHFIVSQLRLDAELVIQETASLTKVAGWRFRTGDSLANALAYASHRARLDQALQTNLPVEAADIAKILADDPTLDDDLRAVYAEHLIRFALALDEPQHADPVAAVIAQNAPLAQRVQADLLKAIERGSGSLVFELLRRWHTNEVFPKGAQWQAVLHAAILAEMDELVAAHDTESLAAWLADVQALDTSLGIERIAKRILEALLPLVSAAPDIAPRLLLLAVVYMENSVVQKLLGSAGFAKHLPLEMRRFLAALQKTDATLPQNIIPDAANFVEDTARPNVVLLLAEMAYRAGRYELLDAGTLKILAENIAQTANGFAHRDLLIGIARSHTPELIEDTALLAPEYVFQLLIATGEYETLAQTMITFARDVYGVDKQVDYVRTVQRSFAAVPLPTERIAPALATLAAQGISGVPRLGVTAGILEASDGTAQLAPLATDALQEIDMTPRYTDVMPVEILNGLLHYALAVPSEGLVRRVLRWLPSVAAQQDDDRAALHAISQAHKHLRDPYAALALEVLCGYVRLAPEKPAQRVMQHYSKEAAPETIARLNMAFQWRVFSGRMAFRAYMEAIHTTANLLDTALAGYVRRQDRPTMQRLMTAADQWRTRLDTKAQRQLGAEMLKVAKLLAALGKHAVSHSAKNTEAILQGTETPVTPAEVWRAVGGHLARGKAYPHKIQPPVEPLITPFGDTGANSLLEHFASAGLILKGALDSLTTDKAAWQPAALIAEVDSLVANSDEKESKIIRQWAQDCQRLADLIGLAIKDTDVNVVQDDNKAGKKLEDRQQEPHNLLELLRFLYGCLRE